MVSSISMAMPRGMVVTSQTDTSATTLSASGALDTKMRLDGVSVYYKTFVAVADVRMLVYTHQITAIIGPSGCGKSTLLRSLNRMNDLVPGARLTGTVLLDGEDVYAPNMDVVDIRRRVGMVFQRPNPFPKSIYDNVAYGPRLYGGVTKSQLDEMVEKSLRRAALWDEVKDKLKQSGMALSGGQQQRLCIARAIAVEPEVILMDEPCSALDPVATLKIEELMQELQEGLYHRHRHTQHAAGRACQRPHRHDDDAPRSRGRDDRVRRDDQDVHPFPATNAPKIM